MKLKTILFGFLAVSLALIFTLAAPAGDVLADDGGCTAYVNGVDVSEYNRPGNALEVYEDENLALQFYAPTPIDSYKIKIYATDIAPFWTIDETYNGVATSFEDTVDVADYTNYGVGLYKVVASADLGDDTCSVEAVYIKVIGGSWLSTTAGIIAIALLSAGLILLLIRFLTLFRGTSPRGWILFGLLLPILPFAVLTTSGDSQTTGSEDASQASSSSNDTSGGGIKFRLRISIVSIVGSLFAAIGLVLMFQQMGTVYPTITIVVLSLVLALVAGILLPSFAQMFARRK